VLRFTVKRLIGAVPTLLLIVTISFFLMRMAPGGPFDKERTVPAEIEARLEHAYHLDDSLPLQFLRYLGNLARGDFGPSFLY
jgi:oligopeptide transport system permease protein